jgi:hypothetical protein
MAVTPTPVGDFTFDCCSTCLFNSMFADRVTAECHRYPNMNEEGQFKELPATEWCGEFKAGTAYRK